MQVAPNFEPSRQPPVPGCLSNDELRLRAREQRLVSAAIRGDAGAFTDLCSSATPAILNRLLHITNNREDAEDALQDALLRAFSSLRTFRGNSRFSTWLTRIAINSALMLLRKKRLRREVFVIDEREPGEPEGWNPVDGASNPEDGYMLSERRGVVREAVLSLRPAIRDAVLLRAQELSVGEAADRLGISVAAAKGRLFHARVALRKACRLASAGASRRSRIGFSRSPVQAHARCAAFQAQ